MATISESLALAVQHHQAGRLQAAEQIYRQILTKEPRQPDAIHLLGVIAWQVGQPEVAVEYIERAIQLKGTDAAFHCNLGNAFLDQGKLDEAISGYRRALELKPDYVEARYNLGNAFTAQGRLDEGIACYRRVLELKPDHAEACYNLGNGFMAQGKPAEAVACYRRALELKPDDAEAHGNLGNAFKAQDNLEEAVGCYRRALALNADYTDAHYNLGNALRAQGKLDEAVACYRRALELKPDYAEALNNLGNAFEALGNPDEAVACYRRALALRPEYLDVYNNLGNAFTAQGKLDEAVACCRQALEWKPTSADAHSNLGDALKAQGKLDEAVACYRRALELKPELLEAANNLGNVFKAQGKLDEAVGCHRRALETKADAVVAHSNLVMNLNYCTGYDAQAIYEEARRWDQQHAEPLARFIQPHSNDRSANRRLRIGYVSPDFRDHVVGRFMLPLFREHDHQQFEVVCYSNVRHPDTFTPRFERCADNWRDAASLTDEALAQRIREDRIDILVDLALHTADNRLLVFARKPAPVQATFAGYPGTTGLSTMAYRITDSYLDPPGLNDHHYSEESLRLADTFWCYDPLTREPAVSALPALEKGCITFGCLNNFCKVNAVVLRLWAKVLQAVDRSQIIILAPDGSHRQQALDLLGHEGIAPDRVTFVGWRPRAQYLELYHRIDVGLDTVPYNGHATSLDSFWMGVPVVTMLGQTVVGRAGLSQLMKLGLPELIAESPQQFVSIAAGLAADLPRLSKLRATLRPTLQDSPLMDAASFARNVEAAYRTMWQRWCDSQSGTNAAANS